MSNSNYGYAWPESEVSAYDNREFMALGAALASLADQNVELGSRDRAVLAAYLSELGQIEEAKAHLPTLFPY